MKITRFFYTLCLIAGFATTGFSQDIKQLAHSEGKTELTKSKENGVYNFILPEGITASHVEKAAGYYTKMMSIEFDESNNNAHIELTENTQGNRIVIARFLTACKAQTIKIDNEEIRMTEFINEYLKD